MLATSEYPAGVRFLCWLTLTAVGSVAIGAANTDDPAVADAAYES
jgi:hypothetical protein